MGASPLPPEVFGDAHIRNDSDSNNDTGQFINEKDSIIQISNKNSLIWVTADVNGQEISAMIDSGANPNCISLRCVRGSDYLNSLARSQYFGQQIVDANGENIEPCYVLKCSLKLGTPSILIKTEFVVIETLPFSCIIGQTTLTTFKT